MSTDTTTGKPAIADVMDGLPFSRNHLWATAATIFGFLFDSFDMSILSLALPPLTEEWHLSGATGGVISSSVFWGMMAGAVGLGFLSEILGRRKIMIITIVGMAFFTFLCGLAPNVPTFIACRVLVGVFTGAMIPVDLAYLAEISPAKRRGLIMGAIGVAWPFGSLLATGVASVVVPTVGWRWLFYVAIVPALVGVLVSRLVPESPRWLAKKGRYDEMLTSANHLGAGITSVDELDTTDDARPDAPRPSVWGNLRTLFQRRYTIRAIGGCLLYFFNIGMAYGWGVFVPTIIMTALGYPIDKTITAVFLINGASILGRTFVAVTADRLPRVWAVLLAMVVFFACALGMAWVVDLGSGYAWLVLTVMAVFQFAVDMASVFQLWVPELFPSEIRAFSASFASAWGRLGAGTAPILFGFLLGAGNAQAVFYCIAALVVATAAVVLIFLRKSETYGRSLSAAKAA